MPSPRFKKRGVILAMLIIAVVGVGVVKINSSNKSSTASNPAPLSNTVAKPEAIAATAASVKAFDSANTITDSGWFTKAYDDGFRLYILNTTQWGTCNPWDKTQSQIENALAAGLKVAAYTRNPNCWQNGILATGPYQNQLQFFALDIETDPGVALTQAMVNGVKALGIRPVIYTGSTMWSEIEGGYANSFSDLPLWDSNSSTFAYSSWKADYLSPTPVEFGGWNKSATMRVGVQQQLEYTLNGVNIDLNSFNSSFLK